MDAWWNIHYPWRTQLRFVIYLSMIELIYPFECRFFCSTNAHLHRFTESSIHPPPIYVFYSSIKLVILSCIQPSIHFIFIFLSDDQSIPDSVKVVPLEWLQYFDERELELIICGMQNIDTEVRTSLSFRLGPSVCLRTGARICFHQLLDVFAYLKPTTCSLILPVPYLPHILLLFVVRHGFRRFPYLFDLQRLQLYASPNRNSCAALSYLCT